jgi:hypothetical protein
MRNSDSRYSDRVLESTVYVFMIYLRLFSSIDPFDENRSDQVEEVVRPGLRTHNR